MAVNRRWTNRDGQSQEETTWFRVTVWGRQAETANQYLAKGRRVLVEGRISARAFIGNNGHSRASLELDARNLQFLSSRQEDAQVGAANEDYPGGTGVFGEPVMARLDAREGTANEDYPGTDELIREWEELNRGECLPAWFIDFDWPRG